MPRSQLHSSALWYATNKKLPVFPLIPNGKAPLLGKGKGHGVHDATTDVAIINEWWRRNPDANIGIAPTERIIFLDVDNKPATEHAPARNGVPWFQEAYRNGLFPEDLIVAQTPNNGRHAWLFLPSGVVIPNSMDKVSPGIEVRAKGMYVVAPPSVLDGGTVYKFRASHGPRDVGEEEIGPELIALLVAAGAENRPAPSKAKRVDIPADLSCITADELRVFGEQLVQDAIDRIPQEGGRHNAGVWLFAQLRDCNLDTMTAEILAEQYQQRVEHAGEHPYPWKQAHKSFESVFFDDHREPHPKLKSMAQKKQREAARQQQRAETVTVSVPAPAPSFSSFDGPEDEAPDDVPDAEQFDTAEAVALVDKIVDNIRGVYVEEPEEPEPAPVFDEEIALDTLEPAELIEIIRGMEVTITALNLDLDGERDRADNAEAEESRLLALLKVEQANVTQLKDANQSLTIDLNMAQSKLVESTNAARMGRYEQRLAELEQSLETEQREHEATRFILELLEKDFTWSKQMLGMKNVPQPIKITLFFTRNHILQKKQELGLSDDNYNAMVHISVAQIAEVSAQDPKTVGRHLKQAQALGLLDGKKTTRVVAASGHSASRVSVRVSKEFMETPKKLEPQEKRNWGGKRERCPNPECHGIKIRATGYHCMDCGTEWESHAQEEMLEAVETARQEAAAKPRSRRVLSMAVIAPPADEVVGGQVVRPEIEPVSEPSIEDFISEPEILGGQVVHPADDPYWDNNVPYIEGIIDYPNDPPSGEDLAALGFDDPGDVYTDESGLAYRVTGYLWPNGPDENGDALPAGEIREYIPAPLSLDDL